MALRVLSKFQAADENGRHKLAMAGLGTAAPVRGYRLPVLKTDYPIPSNTSASFLRMTFSTDNLLTCGLNLVFGVLIQQEQLFFDLFTRQGYGQGVLSPELQVWAVLNSGISTSSFRQKSRTGKIVVTAHANRSSIRAIKFQRQGLAR